MRNGGEDFFSKIFDPNNIRALGKILNLTAKIMANAQRRKKGENSIVKVGRTDQVSDKGASRGSKEGTSKEK